MTTDRYINEKDETDNTEKLGDVLKAYLQNTRLGKQMGEQRALNVWPQITGPLAKHTMELKVYNSIYMQTQLFGGLGLPAKQQAATAG